MEANLRTIIGMLGSVVMASCSTTTIDERDITQIPIEFGSSVSRAAVNDATGMSSFSVWGGYDGTNNLFEKTTVTKDGVYEGGTRYWVPNKTFNFYAVHPSTLQNIEVSEGNIKVSDFDCSATGNDAIDLMTAVASRTTSNPMNEQDVATVPISFKHELAKVRFTIKSEVSDVEIVQFKAYNVIYQGTLTSLWENVIKNFENDNIYKALPFSLTTTNGLTKDVFGDILIIPHDNTNLKSAILLLSYKYIGEQNIKTQTLPLVIENVIEKWEAGKSYNYSLTIKPNGITFTGLSADVWSETSSGGNIIIKLN